MDLTVGVCDRLIELRDPRSGRDPSLSFRMTTLRSVRLFADFAEDDAGIDAAESERIAHNIIQLGGAAAIWHDVEIASRIGILIIDRRRDPLSIQPDCTKCSFDRAGRAERMRVIALRSAHWHFARLFA